MEAPHEVRTFSGRYTILFLMGLGVAAAIGSQWYYARLQQRPLRLWGPSNAKMMLDAPLANAMVLGPPDAKPLGEVRDRIKPVGGERLTVLAERDVTLQPGFIHVRNSFIHADSFDWDADLAACQPEWKYAIDFTSGDVDVTLLFAPNCQQVQLAQTGATASMKPRFDAIMKFFEEQFPETVPKK